MKPVFAALSITILACSVATSPDSTRVVGTIIGFSANDPRVEIVAQGSTAHVTIITYGSGCDSIADTDARVLGLVAEVTPHDLRGTCPQRNLVELRHTVDVTFSQQGTAQIVVKGVDATRRSSANPNGDLVSIQREVVLR
jgi:hypothetical protein